MQQAAINVGGHLLSALAIEHFILRLPCDLASVSIKFNVLGKLTEIPNMVNETPNMPLGILKLSEFHLLFQVTLAS